MDVVTEYGEYRFNAAPFVMLGLGSPKLAISRSTGRMSTQLLLCHTIQQRYIYQTILRATAVGNRELGLTTRKSAVQVTNGSIIAYAYASQFEKSSK